MHNLLPWCKSWKHLEPLPMEINVSFVFGSSWCARTAHVHSLLSPPLFRYLSSQVYVEVGEVCKTFGAHWC